MDFRLINEQTIEQVKDLWDYCFEKADTPFFQWYFQEYTLKQNKIMGGFEENKLKTMVHLNPLKIKLGAKEENMPYLVGVATAPEARGKHAIKGLFQTTFTLAKAMGSKAVLLQPIYAGIYFPYGFSYTYLRTSYKVPLAQLKYGNFSEELKIVRKDPKECKDILPDIYAQGLNNYNGYVLRDARLWENYLTVAALENTETVLVVKDDKVVGYALYTREEENINVLELIALDGIIHNRLLAYFQGFAGNFKYLVWLGTGDDLSYLSWPDQKLAPRVAPFMMGRVIDVPKVLQERPVPADCPESSLVLFIEDEFMPSNNLLLQLNISSQGIELKDTIKAPEIIMDISAFNQLYFGTYSVNQLWSKGKILAEEQSKLHILSRLFPAQNNYINEYF